MKWITHIAIGIFAVKLTEIASQTALLDVPHAYVVALLYSVLPDIDFLLKLKHRAWTHTIYFALLSPLPLLIFNWKLVLVGLIAILSHLLGDMMTVSGLRLLYPRKTVFYLVPPTLRFKTGSSVEFFILGMFIIGSIGLVQIEQASESAQIIELSKKNVVTASFSYFENGAVYHVFNEKIVWTDGKNKIGIIKNGKLVKISKDQILNFEIIELEPKQPILMEQSADVKIKSLKRSVWKHRIITAYCDDPDDEITSFSGTGYDLYRTLRKKYDDDVKIIVWYYEAR